MTRTQLIDQAVKSALRPGQPGGVGLNWPKGKRQADWGLKRVREAWRVETIRQALREATENWWPTQRISFTQLLSVPPLPKPQDWSKDQWKQYSALRHFIEPSKPLGPLAQSSTET